MDMQLPHLWHNSISRENTKKTPMSPSKKMSRLLKTEKTNNEVKKMKLLLKDAISTTVGKDDGKGLFAWTCKWQGQVLWMVSSWCSIENSVLSLHATPQNSLFLMRKSRKFQLNT